MTAPARTWLYAVVGVLLAAIGGGTWMMTRQQEIPALGSQLAAPAAPAAMVDRIDKLAPPAPAPQPAVAHTPAQPPAPAGTAPVVPAVPSVATQVSVPGPAPDSASWKALSRPAKSKSSSGHKRVRSRPPAEAADGDDKTAPAASESQKADPFAD